MGRCVRAVDDRKCIGGVCAVGNENGAPIEGDVLGETIRLDLGNDGVDIFREFLLVALGAVHRIVCRYRAG